MASPNLSAASLRDLVFQTNDPKRLVLKLKTAQFDSTDYRSSSAEFISQIFPNFSTDPRIRFLAIGIWTDRTFLVLDINNNEYNFETAHNDRTILPVYVIRQYRRNSKWALIRWAPEDILLAANLANMHNRHGWGATLPLLEDRTNISTMAFANPRELRPSAVENEFYEGS
ncbi:uncharacterized protein BDV14DRAFT_201113 [Aspergillus stella-maris]|uniref:uncharacterized protein n=1 Tax=Aspergillus stella-maris TaxID=1810926 RepID=UPI003CCE2B93